jgi:hypothetical protein
LFVEGLGAGFHTFGFGEEEDEAIGVEVDLCVCVYVCVEGMRVNFLVGLLLVGHVYRHIYTHTHNTYIGESREEGLKEEAINGRVRKVAVLAGEVCVLGDAHGVVDEQVLEGGGFGGFATDALVCDVCMYL